MKKSMFLSAPKKARIALAVMVLCGMTFVSASDAFAANENSRYINETMSDGTTASENTTDDGTEQVILGIKNTVKTIMLQLLVLKIRFIQIAPIIKMLELIL